jgi:hypothetical protein
MAPDMEEPAPRGLVEKISGTPPLLLAGVVLASALSNRAAVGLWPALVYSALIIGTGVFLAHRLAAPQREARRARDARAGLVECGFRRAEAGEAGRAASWTPGTARVDHGSLRFRPRSGNSAEAFGPAVLLLPFDLGGAVSPAAARRLRLDPSSQWVRTATSQGPVELAATDAGLRLLGASPERTGR